MLDDALDLQRGPVLLGSRIGLAQAWPLAQSLGRAIEPVEAQEVVLDRSTSTLSNPASFA